MTTQELLQEKRIELVRRMIKSYNKNKNKIENKPKTPELSQSEKRRGKLIDLKSRSGKHGKVSLKGLESYEYYMNEDLNAYIQTFRKMYYSSKTLTFRKWLDEIESLLDTI